MSHYGLAECTDELEMVFVDNLARGLSGAKPSFKNGLTWKCIKLCQALKSVIKHTLLVPNTKKVASASGFVSHS